MRTGLSLQTKIRLYNALVISVLLYGSETWTLLEADERRLEAFHMNCQRRILGIRWFHFVTNASVTSQTGEEGLAIRICRRRLSIFGHVRQLPESTPAHYAGGKLDIRPEWKRQRGRPCRTWVQQIEDDTGLNANDAWRIAHDRKSWRALRPVAGQAFHWLTVMVLPLLFSNSGKCNSTAIWLRFDCTTSWKILTTAPWLSVYQRYGRVVITILVNTSPIFLMLCFQSFYPMVVFLMWVKLLHLLPDLYCSRCGRLFPCRFLPPVTVVD